MKKILKLDLIETIFRLKQLINIYPIKFIIRLNSV